jgi:hypothetical protein
MCGCMCACVFMSQWCMHVWMRVRQAASEYNYLRHSGCTSVQGLDDVAGFEGVRRSLQCIGVSSADQSAIFRVLSAVLSLGNINFSGVCDVVVCVVTPRSFIVTLLLLLSTAAMPESDRDGEPFSIVTSPAALSAAASLLGLVDTGGQCAV